MDEIDDPKLSLIDHLEELRKRIFVMLYVTVAMYVPGFYLAKPAIERLQQYGCPPNTELVYTGVMDWFFTQLSMGFVFALLFASPVIAYQIWKFVAPALFKHERVAISRVSGFSCFLFLFGIAFAGLFIFPAIMRFSYGMETENIKPLLRVDSVVYLAVMLMLGFGVMFQLPIVIFFLALSGLVSIDTIRKSRPYFIVIIFIVSAIMTPPDIISQIAMALPSWLLFEISLLFARAALRKKKAKEEAEEAERQQEEAAEAENSNSTLQPTEITPLPENGAVAASSTPPVIPNPIYKDPAEDTTSYEEFMDDEQYSDSPEDIYAYQQTSVDQSPTEKQVRIRNITPARHFRRRNSGRK
ncbi:MAG: twin-arginine translocase subunit TatC [Victivallales bacterium]|nr:twin-arginine translocase subunit TatC [Victivallales bacterium]